MESSNLQELKDAAIELIRFTCNSCERRLCEEDAEEEDGRSVPSPCSAIIRMRNALSANPLRQCDVGTAEEQVRRHCSMCVAITKNGTKGCDYSKCNLCFAKWAQMPYSEGDK